MGLFPTRVFRPQMSTCTAAAPAQVGVAGGPLCSDPEFARGSVAAFANARLAGATRF